MSISAALAAKMLIWSLVVAGLALLVCLVFPRAFCGYVCPLGTLLDGFDWLLGRRVTCRRLEREGWWANIRYYLLTVVLIAAAFGILLSGFCAAIPVLTRAMLFTLAPAQTGLLKGWYLVPPMNFGQLLSILLVVLIFCLGFLGRRFWCRYACPTGALFSLCNNCGQVCPTGAVRALTLEEKRAARIGLAQVDRSTCLPYVGRGACQLCVDECRMAGYNAIEFIRIGGEVDKKGEPVEDSGRLAPVVREDRCTGCGLCQMRCRAINVKVQKLLPCSAVRVAAGEGKEDRLMSGSYVALRKQRAGQMRNNEERTRSPQDNAGSEYLPDFLK